MTDPNTIPGEDPEEPRDDVVPDQSGPSDVGPDTTFVDDDDVEDDPEESEHVAPTNAEGI